MLLPRFGVIDADALPADQRVLACTEIKGMAHGKVDGPARAFLPLMPVLGSLVMAGRGANHQVVPGDRQPHEDPPPIAARLPRLGPHDTQAYQLYAFGKRQREIAQILNEQHHTQCGQGQVSRMIKRAKAHAEASGLANLIPEPAKPARSIDPARLELGARTDHRSKHQREKPNSDAD